MFKSTFEKLVGKKAEIASYDLIRLLSKTHRALKSHLDETLKQEGITTLDWSILGLLSNRPDGCRYNEIAQELSVEPPFVTELISKLEKKKCVVSHDDPRDRRAKMVTITKKGIATVTQGETRIKENLTSLLKDITASELHTFSSVLEKLTNGSK